MNRRPQRKDDVIPPFPEPLTYLWEWYERLSAKRQNGMDVNGISFRDIEAFAHLNKIELCVWEVQAIESLDAIVIRTQKASRPRAKSRAEPEGQIPVSNVSGIRSLMQGLKARKANHA